MQIVIYSTYLKKTDIPYLEEFLKVLHDSNIRIFVHIDYLEQIREYIKPEYNITPFTGYEDFEKYKIDFVITLGGDGTILNASTLVRDSKVPILGINLGRLGFLAAIEKTKISNAITLLEKGMYQIEKRSLLRLESDAPLFGEIPFALNDFTILKRDTSSMITIHTFIDGAYLNSYWADGIIIATPTGSTGYSLSCGGPIIFPNSGNFVITPVAPHNLNIRPIVISDNSVISFEVEGRAENFLCTLDSRFETITSATQLAVRKEDFSIKLVKLNDTSFMSTIRNKMAWGIDKRNH